MEGVSTAAASGSKAPRPFLRRGEGVEKRVFASRYRKAITPVPSSAANSSSSCGGGDSWGAPETAAGRRGSQKEPPRTKPPSDAWSWDGKAAELASETQLLSVDQPPDEHLDTGTTGNRFLRNSLKAAWASRQAEEELELEEFRALETQIKADVVGAARARPDHGGQALPSSTVTLAPSAPLRSYAAIHQQRPPQPSHGAPRTNSRGSDPQARTHAACASPRPAGRHRYNDAFVGGAAVDADDELAGSFGEQAGGEAPGGDEGSAWGQQQQQQPLSPGKSGAASVAGKVGGTRGFDDADAWNDTSSFFGGGTTAVGGVRKGAAAAAAAGANGNRAPLRGSAFFGRQSQSPASAAQLDDPWAAPAIGDEQYGTSQEAFLDDCSGWSADQQQKLQPQPLSQKGAGDEERGPDQPFVRALFSKPQRQTMQNGGSRTVVKGTAGKSRAAATAAAEPSGPSAAELEKMQQVLEEQLANVASERSTLVRMRTELEKAANRLEQERQAWEKTRAEEQAKWEAQREAEEGKLRRDRRVLEKQSKALLKLPNKKERTAMEAAEAALEAERREGRAREARHKLTVERLRRQLVELQERNQELREEVRWHEAQQLERGWGCPAGAATGGGASAGAKGAGPGAAPPPAKPRPGRTIAVQTEPLAFLPPLECVGAGHVSQPDTATSRSFSAPFGGPQRADGGPPAVIVAGSRTKSSGMAAPSVGGRLRGMQTVGRGHADASVGAVQPAQPTSWRAERAAVRKSGSPLQWQGREQAYDVGDEYDTGCGGEVDAEEDLGEVEDGEAELLGGAARCGGAGGGGRDGVYVGWRRGGACAPSGPGSPSSYSYVQNDDVEVLTDEAAGPDGAYSDSVSAVAWRQHQDFMNRVGLEPGDGRRPGPPPAGSESPRQGRRAFPGAAGPRQQQQQQQGQQRQQPLPPPWGRAGDADASSAQEFSSTHQRPGTSDRLSRPPELQQQDQHQHQHQHQQQQQQTVWQAYGPGGGQQSSRQSGSAGRPAAAASSMPPQLATDLRGGPAPWEEAYPDQEAATREPLPGSSQGGPAASPPGSPRWAAHGAPPGPGPGAGKGATAPRVFFGPRGSEAAPAAARTRGGIPPAAGQTSGPTSATAPAPVVVSMAVSTGSGRSAGHGSPARPSSPLRGSLAELDGVSQTLAALRMDRRVEAAAAAAAAGGGSTANGAPAAWPGVPSLGRPPHFAAATGQAQSQAGPGSGLQRGLGSQRPGAGSPEAGSEGGWPGDVWSPRSRGGPARESAKSQQPSSVAPMAWGPGPTVGAVGTNGNVGGGVWDGEPLQQRQAQDQRQWQGFPSLNSSHAQPPGQQLPRQQMHLPPPPPPQQHQQHQQHQQPQVAQPPLRQQNAAAGHGSSSAAAPGSQWAHSTMSASAASAASVAHSVSFQQHLQGARTRPPGPHAGAGSLANGAAKSSASGSGGGGASGGGSGDGSGVVGHVTGGSSSSRSGVDSLIREVRHADGKTERMYSSGTRLVLFANGTRKVALLDGSSRVYFSNGDIKWSIPSAAAAFRSPAAAAAAGEAPSPPDVAVVHYYYAEVGTWHSTYGGEGGVEVFYFPSGQTEAHHPGYGKEIMFPDGVLRVVTTDGEELDIGWPQLSWAVQQPQPRVDDLGDDDL